MAHLIDNQVFLAFSTYATIVIVKMMMMAPLTAYYRLTRKAFANEEDARVHGKTPEDKKKMLRVDSDVERVRRCHQNDLENIIPFVLIGLLYSLTGPDLSTALFHFRVFVGSRFCHTVAYVCSLPQPSRGLPWLVGVVVTLSMAYSVICSTW
ncbi:microsomal glutathione S-transferase 1-like [Aplochiton taeniatus]